MASPEQINLFPAETSLPEYVIPGPDAPRMGAAAVRGASITEEEIGPTSRRAELTQEEAAKNLSEQIASYKEQVEAINPVLAASRRFRLLEYGAEALGSINSPRNQEDYSGKKPGKMTKEDALNLLKAEGLGIFANAENILPAEGQYGYEIDRFEIVANQLLDRTIENKSGLTDAELDSLTASLAGVFSASHTLLKTAVPRKWDSTDSENTKKILALRLHLRRTAGFKRPPRAKPVITSMVIHSAWEAADRKQTAQK